MMRTIRSLCFSVLWPALSDGWQNVDKRGEYVDKYALRKNFSCECLVLGRVNLSPVCIGYPLSLVWIHVADLDLFKVHTLAIDA